MPRAVDFVTQNFSFRTLKHQIAVSSTFDDSFNNRTLELIEKHDGMVIYGPTSLDQFSDSKYKDFDMMKPTLLEENIYYRTSHKGVSRSRVEFFEFRGGEFIFLEHRDLMFYFQGFMLNRRFLVNEKRSFDGKILEILDLTQEINAVCCHINDDVQRFRYIEQSGLVCVIGVPRRGNYKCLCVISLVESQPIVIGGHPLLDIGIIALDLTPGAQHCIVEREGKPWACVVGDELTYLPFADDAYLSFMNDFSSKEFVRILGSVVLCPMNYKFCFDVYCDQWNFVLLENVIYCTEFDANSGQSIFYQMRKQTTRCMFCFGLDLIPLSEKLMNQNFFTFPIVGNFYKNSVTLLSPSDDFKNHTLQGMHRFYDLEEEKHSYSWFTEDDDRTCRLYIDDRLVASFDIPKDVRSYKVALNNRIYVVCFQFSEFDHLVLVNGTQVCRANNIRYLKVVMSGLLGINIMLH
ncbi:hypothetical protein PCE1_003276 [Barthelona sp. PCE]